jgi:serine/threonine protein kinase
VNLEEVFESKAKVKIVMEYISGGELFDAIVANEHYSEQDASKLIQQVVTTVDYVHQKNIVHRDIKPENLLFETRGSNVLKLIDFGIAIELPATGMLYEVVGSRTYMAPEIDRRIGYNKAVDMYAIGVIMYILLCGYPPFDFDQGIYQLAFNSPEWDDISPEAKNLITLLLSDDPLARPTGAELRTHVWVAGKDVPQRQITNNIQATIRSYMDFNKNKTRLGVAGRDRRMSVYSLFNIAKEKGVGGPPDKPPPPVPNPIEKQRQLDDQRVQQLKLDMFNGKSRFEKLKEDMKTISTQTKNNVLKKELEKAMNEVTFLTNAYKELIDSTLPTLTKALNS